MKVIQSYSALTIPLAIATPVERILISVTQTANVPLIVLEFYVVAAERISPWLLDLLIAFTIRIITT